jgi:DNA-binding transcriptional LysR family regulator
LETGFIKEFIVLAETCNFQEAAERSYISLSSLSKHIKAIEKEMGVPLFDRTTRSVKLNEYGLKFYECALQMVRLYDECAGALSKINLDNDNHLSVGFSARFEQCGIIETLSDFSKIHPHISMHMVASNQAKELLHEQKLNFAFDDDACQKDGDIERILFKTDHLVAVLPLEHPLSKEDHVIIEQLREQDFIMHISAPGETSVKFQDYRKLCQAAGFEPNVIMTASFTATVIKLVKQRRGIAIMNRMYIPIPLLSEVAIVDIRPFLSSSVYVLYLKNIIMSPAEKDFLRYIKSVGEQTRL